MDAGRRGITAVTPVAVLSAVVFLFLVMVAPAHATVVTELSIDNNKPVAGGTVTAEGPYTECVNNVAPVYTFTFSTGGRRWPLARERPRPTAPARSTARRSPRPATTPSRTTSSARRTTPNIIRPPSLSRLPRGSVPRFRSPRTRRSSTSRRRLRQRPRAGTWGVAVLVVGDPHADDVGAGRRERGAGRAPVRIGEDPVVVEIPRPRVGRRAAAVAEVSSHSRQ